MKTNEVIVGESVVVIKELDDRKGTILPIGTTCRVLEVHPTYLKTTDPFKAEAVCFFTEPALQSLRKV